MSSTSVRTLIVGIDRAGRIVQHDRNSCELLDPPSGLLMGSHLSDLVIGLAAAEPSLTSLLDAVAASREATVVLTLRCRRGQPTDAVVTVQPMHGGGSLAALVILRMPPPSEERFLDPSLMRHALLDDAFRQIGATLDLDQMARGLTSILVPHFCNVATLHLLEGLVVADELPTPSAGDSYLLRRMALSIDDADPRWNAALPTGEVIRFPPGTPNHQCLSKGKPVREANADEVDQGRFLRAWLRRSAAELLSGTSLLLLPLTARNTTFGYLFCARRAGYRPFDASDTEIGMEFASRAAIFIDNARRYSRERATAITLQRSLLPTGLSAPSSVEVRHRYLPGSQLIEVGGDWYESIALPGARAALVVGDVAGHGVRAAVTMGRLRTAIETLAMLELSPAESLHRLNELMRAIGAREPHFATCAYAVYDAVAGTCEVASAGHPPPLLVRPGGGSEFLDVPPEPPLGVGEGPIESKVFQIEDGSLLVLYTDGLVESRDRDIEDGLLRLQQVFGPDTAKRPLAELCQAALAGAYSDQQRDDIAVLLARLNRIDPGRESSWVLPSELTSPSRARSLVAEPLERWGLDSLLPTSQLLVSELVTNAIRYSRGPVTLRLILEDKLTCEVHDNSAVAPQLRHASRDEESGRGLHIVSQLSQRWGTRREPAGKVVWCQQQLPRRDPAGQLPRAAPAQGATRANQLA